MYFNIHSLSNNLSFAEEEVLCSKKTLTIGVEMRGG